MPEPSSPNQSKSTGRDFVSRYNDEYPTFRDRLNAPRYEAHNYGSALPGDHVTAQRIYSKIKEGTDTRAHLEGLIGPRLTCENTTQIPASTMGPSIRETNISIGESQDETPSQSKAKEQK